MAQTNRADIAERVTDGRYTFRIESRDVEKRDLIRAFTRATGQVLLGSFSGNWEETNELGVTTTMDTRPRRLSVSYDGHDPAALADARRQAALIRRLLTPEVAATPQPPARQ